jgi:chromosome partitioning protein
MLKPGDLLDYGRSISKLLRTEDWEALVTVIFFSLVIGFFLGWLYYRFLDPRIRTKLKRQEQAQKTDQNALGQALTDEGEIWRLYPPKAPPNYEPPIDISRPKIVVIANNKGGVGKTPLTMYLAEYFRRKGKQVLVIDMDPQGSLSGAMLRAGSISIPSNQSHKLCYVSRLLDGTPIGSWEAISLGGSLSTVQLVTADYTLTKHETTLLLRWLEQKGEPDVRYYLATALSSEHVRSESAGFDVVLIDAPPRLSTGAINALVACTHLVVPTSLDPLAAETVRSFLRQAWAVRMRLNKSFMLAGVVATMTTARPLGKPLRGSELDAAAIAREGLKEWQISPYFFERDIQDLAAISNNAGRNIAYKGKVAQMFDQFGDELWRRIDLCECMRFVGSFACWRLGMPVTMSTRPREPFES